MQRYADYRRLARIAGQIGMRKRDDTTAEAAPVEPRQVGQGAQVGSDRPAAVGVRVGGVANCRGCYLLQSLMVCSGSGATL